METASQQTERYKTVQAINADYRNTDYDRGHLNPNFYQCGEGRTATFTLTNAVPQDPCFNQQSWRKMEEAAMRTMRTNCSFSGARRYFVTGIVQQRIRIPNREHDLEGDVAHRDFNRVTVPSYLWTAVCCDASSSGNRENGFSFAYIGKNTADSYVDILSVSELEARLLSNDLAQDRYQAAKIFVDDCNENSAKSKTARAQVAVPVNLRLANAANDLSRVEQSTIPLKKRKVLQGVVGLIQNNGVSAKGYSLARIELGIDLPREVDVLQEARNAMYTSRASLLLYNAKASLPLLNRDKPEIVASDHDSSSLHHVAPNRHIKNKSNKRESSWLTYLKFRPREPKLDEIDDVKRQRSNDQTTSPPVDEYLIVPNLAADESDVTIQGKRCINSTCGFNGKKEKWCYTDWAKSTEAKCCFTQCKFNGRKDHQTCQTNSTKSTETSCSIRYSSVNVKGQRCLAEHECGLHGYSYYWCYIDLDKNWDYCCQPWHVCSIHTNSYKWCYTGKTKESNYQYCSY